MYINFTCSSFQAKIDIINLTKKPLEKKKTSFSWQQNCKFLRGGCSLVNFTFFFGVDDYLSLIMQTKNGNQWLGPTFSFVIFRGEL